MASFETPIGTLRARLGDVSQGGPVKLYVRPEHMTLSTAAALENSVPVTIGEVSFEGSFIALQAHTANGTVLTAELRNDGSATVPASGSQMQISFDAARASILPDSATVKG